MFGRIALTAIVPVRYAGVRHGPLAAVRRVATYVEYYNHVGLHGAIGYTAEYDLALWLTKVRALVSAWGTPAVHRARVLAAIS